MRDNINQAIAMNTAPDNDTIEALLREAVSYCDGKYTYEDIIHRLQTQTAQLWLHGQSVGVTWVETYPRKKVLTVAFVGGNLDEILPIFDQVRDYARDLGCQAVEVHGRQGWEKVLKSYGFDKVSTTMRYAL